MQVSAVIEFATVSKSYQLGEAQTSLRETLAELAVRAVRRRRAVDNPLFWALRDVSFSVAEGDILGIIGHNGAGKSTILKLLSRVTFPTSGAITTRGRSAGLIELGAGFHPDLSGRENVFLNGTILGMKEREIRARFDSIVDFAGLEKFIDTPVKRYSSGMYVRLAFAVAAHIKADLLLVDEVLSVGDSAFQQKCLNKMRELHREGATIVFVSHSLWTVQTFCNRVILLRKGQVELDDAPDTVIEQYRLSEKEDLLAAQDPAQPLVHKDAADEVEADTVITRVVVCDVRQQESAHFEFFDRVVLHIHYSSRKRVDDPVFIIRVSRPDGVICFAMNNRQDAQRAIDVGEGVLRVVMGPLPLVPDLYSVQCFIADRTLPIVYASHANTTFRILGELSDSDASGVFAPDVHWQYDETGEYR